MQIAVVEILFQDSLYDSGTFFFFLTVSSFFFSFRCYIRGSYLHSFRVFLFEWSLATLNRTIGPYIYVLLAYLIIDVMKIGFLPNFSGFLSLLILSFSPFSFAYYPAPRMLNLLAV